MFLVVLLPLVFNQAVFGVPGFTQVGLDPVVELYEFTNVDTVLASLECTDPIENDDVIVSLDSVSPSTAPCANCFQVYPNCGSAGTGTNNFCVRFLPVGTLRYSTQDEYSLNFSCEDVTGETAVDSYTLLVRLRPNLPPAFNTFGSVTTTVTGTENVKAGGLIYNVGCTDPDQDTLQYTLSTDPITTNIFQIDSSGNILAQADLSSFCRSFITFDVTCKDPYNAAVGPVSIRATLSGANQQPSITGISFNRDVPEDTTIDTMLGTFTVNDDDNVNCLLFASPTESLQYFDLNSAQRSIIVKSKLDYEQTQTRNTNLTVTCSDGFCTSNAAYLYVRVTEVNEPIELFPQDFTLSTYEGNIDIDPKWTPIDEDVGDDPTYTIVGGNALGRFSINPTSGRITSTLEYDVDGQAMATRDTIVVQVKDEGDHTSTTTVSLTILDRNDNRPTFNDVATQTFSVQDCTAPGTSAGSIVATDADSTFQGNNVLTYSGSNGPLTVSPNGAILVGSAITAGTTYSVQVTATDAGEFPQALSSRTPATVTVSVTSCPTTTTTAATTTVNATALAEAAAAATAAAAAAAAARAAAAAATAAAAAGATVSTTEANTADSLEENLGWIVVAALLGTVFLAALGYMIYRYCIPYAGQIGGFCEGLCGDCCVQRERVTYAKEKKVTTVQPAYRGNPPEAGNSGFWQERYPDDDYNGRDPMRDRLPTPANYEAGTAPLAENYHINHTWRSTTGAIPY
ncbi:cadherin EGF LAG seven-pass G-type receptor 2-like isoform X2 [Littorina saxatilis]|uniref:cadherin EGF LAG seven-pass G-type receptor 2-like isoform X2 n=1 Tax=Littorina saxatilis TaxID=31220 RepID=UPI0038B6AC60